MYSNVKYVVSWSNKTFSKILDMEGNSEIGLQFDKFESSSFFV